MISLDFSVVYQIILFLVLWLILSRVLFRPYVNLLEERERRISGTRHDSVELEQAGARLKAEYDDKIARAQAAGAAAKEAILQEARQGREQLLGQARQEAAAILEGARREIEIQMTRERQLAAKEVALVARQMAGKILGRDLA